MDNLHELIICTKKESCGTMEQQYYLVLRHTRINKSWNSSHVYDSMEARCWWISSYYIVSKNLEFLPAPRQGFGVAVGARSRRSGVVHFQRKWSWSRSSTLDWNAAGTSGLKDSSTSDVSHKMLLYYWLSSHNLIATLDIMLVHLF